jgi:hypothetical protein
MVKFGKERFPPNYQSAVGMHAREVLHQNSIELANLIQQYGLLEHSKTIFELGSGPARNLYYIWLKNQNLQLYCSDLFKDASLENTHPDIVNVLSFFEGDSEDIINDVLVDDLDIFLVSDHFMHLQYEKADVIIESICSKWKPRYLVLRELKKQFETPNHPRLYHNYDRFLEYYDIIHSGDSTQDSCYFIWIMQNKHI